jgi:cysteinyl-tRNA synthetase
LTKTRSSVRSAASNEAGIDVAVVAAILAQRAAARAERNWKESDRLRDQLAELGVAIKDSKDGTTWEVAR